MDALSGTVNGTLSAWKGYLKDRDESKSENHSVVSNSSRPHELYSPWNSPGQNTGVGSCSLEYIYANTCEGVNVNIHGERKED